MNLSFQIEISSLDEFFEHWSSRYFYDSEEPYTANIGKPLTEESLWALFEWKNGRALSDQKHASVCKNYPLSFPGEAEKRYLDHRKGGGAIWNIFYLHCLDPSTWPIFDQHTYRAMKYIQTGKIIEIGTTNKQKYESYAQEYRPFLKSLNQKDSRKTDKALFAFGQFLKMAGKYK